MTLLTLMKAHTSIVISDAMRLTTPITSHAGEARFASAPSIARFSNDPRPA